MTKETEEFPVIVMGGNREGGMTLRASKVGRAISRFRRHTSDISNRFVTNETMGCQQKFVIEGTEDEIIFTEVFRINRDSIQADITF